jgi:hypothetical protein
MVAKKDGNLIDPAGWFEVKYEVTSSGAILVRLDGFIAWRSHKEQESEQTLLTQQ